LVCHKKDLLLLVFLILFELEIVIDVQTQVQSMCHALEHQEVNSPICGENRSIVVRSNGKNCVQFICL
jgi:hypothetical protein